MAIYLKSLLTEKLSKSEITREKKVVEGGKKFKTRERGKGRSSQMQSLKKQLEETRRPSSMNSA